MMLRISDHEGAHYPTQERVDRQPDKHQRCDRCPVRTGSDRVHDDDCHGRGPERAEREEQGVPGVQVPVEDRDSAERRPRRDAGHTRLSQGVAENRLQCGTRHGQRGTANGRKHNPRQPKLQHDSNIPLAHRSERRKPQLAPHDRPDVERRDPHGPQRHGNAQAHHQQRRQAQERNDHAHSRRRSARACDRCRTRKWDLDHGHEMEYQ